jgi:uncharacterized protein YbbK (DUF523 family)
VQHGGGHKPDRFLVNTLGQFIAWVPVCPEVEMGLPIPRGEPMHLEYDSEDPRLVTIRMRRDFTKLMQAWARRRAEELAAVGLQGFVFKPANPCRK